MDHVMTMPAGQKGEAPVGGSFPLGMAGQGSTVRICRIRGSSETKHHLECLGFVEGGCITVISQAAGNMIVESKGARIALGSQMVNRLLVTPA